MAGYYEYSMSNNAVDAYAAGEMPKSKWTKELMLDAIEKAAAEEDISLPIELIKKMPKAFLFEKFFHESSWHHTSKMYNRTYFYEVWLWEDITEEELLEMKATYDLENPKKPRTVKKEVLEVERRCEYITWEGMGYRRRKRTHVAVCPVKGSWAVTPHGKKYIYGNHFRFLASL